MNRAPYLGALALLLSLPLPGRAELRALDDPGLAEITGQGGVTLELETRLTLDRLTWTDEGALSVNGLRLSGPGDTSLDNLKITVDLAGDGEVLSHGFSEIARRAAAGQLDTADPDVAAALAEYALPGGFGRAFGAGDLVLHLGAIDYGNPTRLADFLRAVDFELAMDRVVTAGTEGNTDLFSDVLLQGYLGPTDLVVRNRASQTRTLANGNQVSGAELELDTHFEISDGHLNWGCRGPDSAVQLRRRPHRGPADPQPPGRRHPRPLRHGPRHREAVPGHQRRFRPRRPVGARGGIPGRHRHAGVQGRRHQHR